MSASPASRLSETRCLMPIRPIPPLGRRLVGERRRPILFRSRSGTYSEIGELRNHGRLGRTASREPGPRGGDEIRHEHGQDEQGADDPGLGVPRRVRERQPVSQVQDDEDREDHAGHRSRAAEDADATEQDHRDDVELEALGGAAANGPEARQEENARERGNDAAHGKDGQLHAPDADTREPRDLRAAAHNVGVAAESGELEQHGRADQKYRKDHERQRERTEEGLLPKPVEPFGETADRPVPHEQERGAAIANQPGEGNGERRQTDDRYPVAVEEPAASPPSARGGARWPAPRGGGSARVTAARSSPRRRA